jgi:hypothetical protein
MTSWKGEKIMHNKYKLGLPPMYEFAYLSDFSSDIRNQLYPFLKGVKRWVYIHGGVGRGKTHLAAALYKIIFGYDTKVRFWTDKYDGMQSYFITPNEMMDLINDTYNPTSSTTKVKLMGEFCTRPIVIDDLGVENNTGHTAAQLMTIINSRYNDGGSMGGPITIITSNLSLKDLARKYNDHHMPSRMADSVIILLNGPDLRLEKVRREMAHRERMKDYAGEPIPHGPEIEEAIRKAREGSEKAEVSGTGTEVKEGGLYWADTGAKYTGPDLDLPENEELSLALIDKVVYHPGPVPEEHCPTDWSPLNEDGTCPCADIGHPRRVV